MLDQGLLPLHSGQTVEEAGGNMTAAEALHDVARAPAGQDTVVVADTTAALELVGGECLSPGLFVW